MKQVTDEKLFTQFPPVSTHEWEDKIKCDLKGADYEKKLVWRSSEGFSVQPYYREEHLKGLEYLQSVPGKFPFTRSGKKSSNDWDIRQDIDVKDVKTANSVALDILERGVNSLGLKVNIDVIDTNEKFSSLLKGIQFDCISLNIVAGKDMPHFLTFLLTEAKKRNFNLNELIGSFDYDPLGNLTIKGNYYSEKDQDFAILKNIYLELVKSLPDYKIVSVSANHFSNAGASIVQELAFALSMGCEYLAGLNELGLDTNDISPRIQFTFGTGSNYFMEIAKLRAARTLWAKIVESFGGDENSCLMYIHSVTTEWNKTIYDPYVNMLRATTESMSATLGGADSLEVTPFDLPFSDVSEFSSRIARNTQIILKEEAYFGKVVDPAAGSYYIENLTDKIADQAWALFLEIEDKGGYSEAFKAGFIQEKVKQTVDQRLKFIALRKEVLLGTNQYPNFKEEVKEKIKIEKFISSEDINHVKVAEPIKVFRGAQEFELIRLAVETSGKKPLVYMLPIGNLAMRKARSNFSCNFFACAGYEVVDNNGFSTPEAGVKAAVEAKADIVVICSSDDEYAVFAPQVNDLLVSSAILVVAGEPACKAELEAKGIKNFISVKSNVLETLKYYNKLLGI